MNLINLSNNPPTLSSIKTITQILSYIGNSIIVIGHSQQSLKKLQIMYEIYDCKGEQSVKSGIISNFGVIFLTPYVLYNQTGNYLILVNTLGVKKIIQQNFPAGDSKSIIREVKFQRFEEKARSQKYLLYYSPIYKRIYLLQHLKFNSYEHHIFLRGYEQEKETINYRIIALEEQIPQIVFSPKRIIFICGNQITLYKEKFEPQYFDLSNMEQFDILGYYNEFILQFKEDSSIFTMSLAGVIRPLLEQPVASYWFSYNRLYFLVNRARERKSVVKIFRVGENEMIEQPQLQSQNAGKLLFINSSQIILGSK